MSHSIPFCQISPIPKVFIAMSHWSGLRPLAHYHQWTITKTPPEYPDIAPSHGDSAVMAPQNQSLHTFQHVIDELDVRVGQTKDCLVAELIDQSHIFQPTGTANSPRPMQLQPVLPHSWWVMGSFLLSLGPQFSHVRGGTSFHVSVTSIG